MKLNNQLPVKLLTLTMCAAALICFPYRNYSQQKAKSAEWVSLIKTPEVEISYRYAECNMPATGMHQENVYLKVENKTSQSIRIEWRVEYWYNGKCLGCEGTQSEYVKNLNLKPTEVLSGECIEDPIPELRIFSRMLDRDAGSLLTNFEIRNLKTAIIQ
jgi:hypothetical protein